MNLGMYVRNWPGSRQSGKTKEMMELVQKISKKAGSNCLVLCESEAHAKLLRSQFPGEYGIYVHKLEDKK